MLQGWLPPPPPPCVCMAVQMKPNAFLDMGLTLNKVGG
jgi:hypothetical protein